MDLQEHTPVMNLELVLAADEATTMEVERSTVLPAAPEPRPMGDEVNRGPVRQAIAEHVPVTDLQHAVAAIAATRMEVDRSPVLPAGQEERPVKDGVNPGPVLPALAEHTHR